MLLLFIIDQEETASHQRHLDQTVRETIAKLINLVCAVKSVEESISCIFKRTDAAQYSQKTLLQMMFMTRNLCRLSVGVIC